MYKINFLIEHYGYFGIIIALVGGIVGLPIPDEFLLTYVGYNVFKGTMSYSLSLISAMVGAMIGITLSYVLGKRLGYPFLMKYGPKFHMSHDRIEKTKKLYEKLGPFVLLVGYYIPGVRHLSAFLAGINGFSLRKFAVFAYSGAFIWVFTFITLGRIVGPDWKVIDQYIVRHTIKFSIFLLIVLIIISLFYWWKQKKSKKG